MGFLGSLVGALCSAVLSFVTGLLQRREYREEGRLQQATADQAAAIQDDEDARAIEARNAGLDRAALLRRLHEQSTGDGQ